MKIIKSLFLCSVVIFAIPSVVNAQFWQDDLSFNLDFTYASKYMWHGFDTFGGNGAFQPSATAQYKDLYVGVWAAYPDSSGFEDVVELDYYIGYDHSFLEDQMYAVDVSLLYTYFDFPNTDSSGDAQEIAIGFSMPQLIPLGDSYLVPNYTLYYNFDGIPSKADIDEGWFHDFGLAYDILLPASPLIQEEQALSLAWMLTYNDGAYGVDSGLSHSTIQALLPGNGTNFI